MMRCTVIAAALAASVGTPSWARASEPLPPPAPPPAEESASYTPLSLALVTPVALPPLDPMVVGGLGLNILYGLSRSTYGIELGAILNHETENMGGVQLSAIANWTGKAAGGIQLAGILNYNEGDCYGVVAGGGSYCGGSGGGLHVAAIYEEVSGRFDGLQLGAGALYAKRPGALLQVAPVALVGSGSAVQIAPLLAGADESLDGIQISTFAVNVLHEFSGLQISLIVFDNQTIPTSGGSCGYNCEIQVWTEFPDARTRGVILAGGVRAQNFAGWLTSATIASVQHRVEGVQLAGLANQGGDTSGIQIAPLFNYAEDLEGLQLSAINVARDVKGLQIGAINVARELTGLQIGAINVAYGNKLPFMVIVNAGF
ncbi:MAG: hypothetical protein IT373_04455 [Polyangiaceae bacterium]|nr:hypothetical protein [Polyangiaceae bacterium]